MKFPKKCMSFYFIDIMDVIAEEIFLTEKFECDVLSPPFIHLDHDDFTDDNTISSQVQRAKLKALPTHLKYVYLGDVNMFPVIISKELIPYEEDKLADTLNMFPVIISKAIGRYEGDKLDPLHASNSFGGGS